MFDKTYLALDGKQYAVRVIAEYDNWVDIEFKDEDGIGDLTFMKVRKGMVK